MTTTLAIGYIYRNTVHHGFMFSVLRYLEKDRSGPRRVATLIGTETLYLAQGRNEVVRRFLGTPADWLLFIDTDISFEPTQVDELLDVAEEKLIEGVNHEQLAPAHPIVAGFYLSNVNNQIIPTWSEKIAVPLVPWAQLEIGVLQRIAACGMGFTLIHRSVLARPAPEPDGWFGHDYVDGYPSGEDVTACARWTAAGIPIVGYGMSVVHRKETNLSIEILRGASAGNAGST